MLALLLTSQQSLVSPVPKPVETAAPQSPNIILIFIDDMGYGDLSCNGALNIQTPNLDKLASEGIRFTNFLSAQAVCSASRASLMTGCYANRVGISGALFPGANVGLAKEEMTIADMLKQKNYATGIFGKSFANSGITGSVARSMEAWVKFNAVSANAVISIGGQANAQLYELMAYSNNLIEHYWGNFTQSSTVLATNTWYNIVIIYDGTTNHYVYINGVQVGFSSTPALNTSNSPIYVGPAVTTTWGAFDGKIAALRIYNRALISTEVTANFNALKSRFGL